MAKKRFEENLAELEKIVKTLEAGDISLDKALDLFKGGVELAKKCHAELEAFEKKVEMIVPSEKGEDIREPFDEY